MRKNIARGFLEDVASGGLPKDVQRRTRLLLLDLLGTALAGTQTKLHQSITNYVVRTMAGTDGRSRLLFTDVSATPEGAALAGGMTIDAIDAHDGHRLTKGHVGCGLLPTLLAMVDDIEKDISGTEFLALLAAGYEIGTRCGIALHAIAPAYHTSGAWNAVNCAAIAGYLLDLNETAFEHALGIAEYHGPRSPMMRVIDHPTMLKDGSGWGALAGVSAAYLAREGFTGAPALTLLSEDVQPIWSKLGREWEVMFQYFKAFPVCRWAQPAIQAVLDLTEETPISPDQVEAIRIHTFHEATRLFQGVPGTTEQAQYAITFPVVAALALGKIGVQEISQSAFQNPELIRLTGLTRCGENRQFNAVFPQERWAMVEITLKDQRTIRSEPTQAKGEGDRQFSDSEIVEKFHQLGANVVPAERLDAIEAAVFSLNNEPQSLLRLQELIFHAPPTELI